MRSTISFFPYRPSTTRQPRSFASRIYIYTTNIPLRHRHQCTSPKNKTMPKYAALDTRVALYIWDPQRLPDYVASSSNPHMPDSRHNTEPVAEEYFKGQEGVNFLGSAMPFYLINAGSDLFSKTRQPVTDSVTSGYQTDHTLDNQSSTAAGNISTPGSASLFSPDAIKDCADEDMDVDSSLSSLHSSMFSSPAAADESNRRNLLGKSHHVNYSTHSDHIWIADTFGGSQRNRPRGRSITPAISYVRTGPAPRKPIMSPKPIKVQIDFSQKSFPPSLENREKEDICVNIFYNGELTHSRLFRALTIRSSTLDEKQPSFSGRRVDTSIEVPWVILPLSQEQDRSEAHEHLSFEERWNKVNCFLLQEAGKWGTDGKFDTFRTPMGEYLEELAKKPVPESMKDKGMVGAKAGIIDVRNRICSCLSTKY